MPRKSLEELLEERGQLKAEQEEFQAAHVRTKEQLKKLQELCRQLEEEENRISVRLVEIHKEIAQVCQDEISVAPVAKKETVMPGVSTKELPPELKDLIPEKEEFKRLVSGGKSARQEVQEAIKNDFVDKTLNEVIGLREWSDREAALRGSGWKMAAGSFELQQRDRVLVAQMSRDGKKVSIVEGSVAGIEMDGGVSVAVGESVLEVDTRGAQSKIYRKTR